ncbi:unnamed protein product [Alternaria burnsii]|nr:unnamed protein product [Alternaria burnsii]
MSYRLGNTVDDDEGWDDNDSDIELLNYYSDTESDYEIVTNNATTAQTVSGNRPRTTQELASDDDVHLPDIAIQRFKMAKGILVKPGDTVELRDHSRREPEALHSGDFLRIKTIIMNMQTDEVRLRGYRLRRTKYVGQIFDWKLNELGMVLRVDEDDYRSPLVAGIEDVKIEEVLRLRECTLTNKPYPFMSFRTDSHTAYPSGMSEKDIKRQIFHESRLTCRVVNVLYISRGRNKPYGGIVRHLYTHEADKSEDCIPNPGYSREIPISVESDMEDDDCVLVSRKRRTRDESPDFEILEERHLKRKTRNSLKQCRLTFGDVFCGAGGASQGAAQAGYYVQWGLDNNERALESYSLNHPGAYAFKMNAHDFPPEGTSKENLRVDVLHLSPPCCYWSPAHTTDGPNDQANYETIYTVGPILKKVKPRIATLEQTFGLATHKQHKRNFLMLLYNIGQAGYNVRYKVQDLSQHGLVQKRKRLLIIAARRGTPLPPFPKPSHGPPGSSLKPFVYINEALTHITRQRPRAMNDPYHKPKLYTNPRPAYNPHTFLKGCITTSSTTATHPSSERAFTPRELSLFQSFPYVYKFTGTKSDATKQIGNAFPPIMAQAMYHIIAKTLNAFDNGLIGAEDDLSELDALLELRGGNHAQQRRRKPSIPGQDDEIIYVPSDSE